MSSMLYIIYEKMPSKKRRLFVCAEDLIRQPFGLPPSPKGKAYSLRIAII